VLRCKCDSEVSEKADGQGHGYRMNGAPQSSTSWLRGGPSAHRATGKVDFFSMEVKSKKLRCLLSMLPL
jgi:hypothetical protein